MMVMMTMMARVSSPSICGFQPHPPKKTQTQKKTYVDHSWGGRIVNYVISASLQTVNSEKDVVA